MISKSFFTALTLFFLAVAPNIYAATCSNASLNGAYGYSTHGFNEATPKQSPARYTPFAQTGLIVYDGQGNISSGTFTYITTTAAGGAFSGTFTGTYNVNPDCSGTAVAVVIDEDIISFALVVLSPQQHTWISTDQPAGGGFINVYSFQKITTSD